ncbi:hypothetical protein [Olleya sp. 1-3]|uniref:hypothetical protein n=1 Tax=Olleya sp. 1-3 TaxID=2058323 RepID=UPI000C34762D|nr:hypothetical protein [Olleya sp. 1-3]PKG52286.1 hypothetical protein CXF54_04250 [Olleya sp. 1-3]
MKKNFADLSQNAQDYINSRFQHYDISGEEAFNTVFSDEIKDLSSDQVVEIIKQKDISHILSQSSSPETVSNLDNVFLEDFAINRSRGAENVTDAEFELAWEDQIADVDFINANETTFDILKGELENIDNTIPIEDIIGGSLIFGTIFTGVETYKAIENKEIELNDAPKFFAIKTGGKTVKYAIIGFSLASSSPIIVSAGVGYLIYKNKMLIGKCFNGVYNFFNHDKTKKYTQLAINGTAVGITSAGNYTYRVITSKQTKNFMIASKDVTFKTTKYLANKSYQFATHENTKKALSKTGKMIVKTFDISEKLAGKLFTRKK